MEQKKNEVKVIIDSKLYTLTGVESEEYISSIAAYLNNKLAELNTDSVIPVSLNPTSVSVAINIADDLFKEREIHKSLNEKTSKSIEENKALKSANSTLHSKINSLNTEVSNLINKVKLLTNETNELKTSNQALSEENSSLKKKNEASQKQIKELKDELSSIKSELDASKTELEKTKSELTEYLENI